MALSQTPWSLATFAQGDQAVAALEVGGVAYRLAPSLARVGLAGQDSVLGLFSDWARSLTALNAAASQVQASDQITAASRLAPVLYPGKILCAGANYYDHLAEMGMPGAKKEDQRLFFFMKPPRNAVVGEGKTVHMPINTQAFDWEVELALVIGKTARNVSVEQALSHVAAYTVAIDFSARDHNRAPETFYKLDWVAGKGHDTCCPMGPRLIPAHQFGDPQQAALKLAVNGTLKQNGNAKDMIFSVAEQIATASRIMPATSSARKTSSPLGTNTLVSKWSNTSLNRSANPRDVVLSSGKGSLGTPNNRRDSA